MTSPTKKFQLNDLSYLFKSTFKEWNKKDPFRQSAVIAYYAIFSIPGLLVLIISIAGYFFGKDNVNRNLIAQISTTMGPTIAAQITEILTKTGQLKSSMFASIVGVIVLLVGATGVFVELQKTLNIIWKVEVVSQKGILPILKARLFSFGLIVAVAFLLLVSLVISTAIAAMSSWIKIDSSGLMETLFTALNFIFSLGVISVLFALMFKILPDVKIKWKYVWLGAAVTGLLFTIGKTALAFYFAKAQPASIYGAAGSVILILLWTSYSSMILFFGAEFTATFATMYSEKITPSEIAKPQLPTS